MSGDPVYHDRRYISLDQRSDIRDNLTCHIGSILIDPLSWHKLLIVRDLMHILYLGAALVGVVRKTVEHHHLS